MDVVGYRKEQDPMGEMQIPDWALWGASTQRAIENFPVSGRKMPLAMIHALGMLKSACAKVSMDLGMLETAKAEAIIAAADEIADGKLDRHFVVDVFQTGSGTSTNMNVNEVISNRAVQSIGKPAGSKETVHPNDHVNLGQSSNDIFPTAMHVAASLMLSEKLKPALLRLGQTLSKKSSDWHDIIKVGRTHLMDATPIRMGQVFAGYAAQAMHSVARVDQAIQALSELAVGGTAVGTGINTHPEFGRRVSEELTRRTGIKFRETTNHVEAQATQDAVVEVSGELKTIAVSLSKIANDIRLLGSGPRCGLSELILPEIQPGSSIMPGKVNPVICESVIQVAIRVIGNDATITYAGFGGVGSIMESNAAMPVIADALLESIQLLANVTELLVSKVIEGMSVNRSRCEELLENSLMMATALTPSIGYDQASRLATRAFAEGKSIRQLAIEMNLVSPERLDELLDPASMTEPGRK